MRYPFWIFNSIAIGLLIVSIAILFFSRQIPPRIIPPSPQELKISHKEISKIDLSKIYNNDLFNTYKEPTPAHEQPAATKPAMPQPPAPRPVQVPMPSPVRFLEPLPIILRGILVVADESNNVALIEDNQTKITKNYTVGDKIGDGYILRIVRNRLIILRSNGQQETLYVTADDPDLKKLLVNRHDWASIVQKIDLNSYAISPEEFIAYIPTLAQFIDTFNLTTVYKKGESIGCRVGILEQNTLAQAMGLRHADVLMSISGIPTKTTQNRLAIYQKITNMTYGDIIIVDLLRDKQPLKISYLLQDFNKPKATTTVAPETSRLGGPKSLREMQEEKVRIMQERHKFAPTVKELRQEQKHDVAMLNRRNNNTLLRTLTE